jgi:hypothetical protein
LITADKKERKDEHDNDNEHDNDWGGEYLFNVSFSSSSSSSSYSPFVLCWRSRGSLGWRAENDRRFPRVTRKSDDDDADGTNYKGDRDDHEYPRKPGAFMGAT